MLSDWQAFTLSSCHLLDVTRTADGLLLHACAEPTTAVCPHCGTASTRVHGHYWRHPQRSARLQDRQAALGFAVGAEGGSVLLDRFHMSASPDTLLRTMKRRPLPQHPTPRVLGVDDWAIRKGVRYGTILVDLERHRVVDVIKERSADALRDWLKAHPGIEIITRDRASDYSRAATSAAPRALQVWIAGTCCAISAVWCGSGCSANASIG